MADVKQLMDKCDACQTYLNSSRRFNQLPVEARADTCKKFKELCRSCFELQQVMNDRIGDVHLLKPADQKGCDLLTRTQHQNLETLISDCEREKRRVKVSKCPFSAASVQADEKALQTALNESGQYRAPRSSVSEGADSAVKGQAYPSVKGQAYPSVKGQAYPSVKGQAYPSVKGQAYPSVKGQAYPSVKGQAYPSVKGQAYPSVKGQAYPYQAYPSVEGQADPSVEGQPYPMGSGEPAARNYGIPYPFTNWF